MNNFLAGCLRHRRTILFLFFFFLLAGLQAYFTIPKESSPDVKIPMLYVSVSYEGISPEDVERLIVKPLEQHLKNVEGIKKYTSSSYEGGGYVMLEFTAGSDSDKALRDVRNKTSDAQADLPKEADAPTVTEINLSLLPVLVVELSGDVSERLLAKVARELKSEIEANKNVLQADIYGRRDEMVEIILHPRALERYGLNFADVIQVFQNNNLVIPAGIWFHKQGSFTLKVPGLIEHADDVLNFPIKVVQGNVIYFKDVAEVHRTFKDPTGFSRTFHGPSMTIEVSKRMGENVIETVASVRTIVNRYLEPFNGKIKAQFQQDESTHIVEMLDDLQNNLILAVLLVMAVIISSLGRRSALLVGLAVPGSFLMGVLVIGLLGYTLNMVVLFSLILAVGMLVDGAIIVVEYADRKRVQGHSWEEAFLLGAQRMAWPVISSTVTILVVFAPLLFWPGVVGQFMKFLPLTLIATLTASILMALIFVPACGVVFSPKTPPTAAEMAQSQSVLASETGSLKDLTGFSRWYAHLLERALDHPKRVLGGALGALVLIVLLYGFFGRGVEFFPDVEPENGVIRMHARGNLSVYEQDALVRQAEKIIQKSPYFASMSILSGTDSQRSGESEDTIGRFSFELIHWDQRPKAETILDELIKPLQNIPGVVMEYEFSKGGPSNGKAIQLELSNVHWDVLQKDALKVFKALKKDPMFEDIDSTLPLPGIDWQIVVDRAQAARYGASLSDIGNAIRLTTNGVTISTYRPDDSEDQIDIIVRFPPTYRTLEQIQNIRINTSQGLVPISLFTKPILKPKRGTISRMDGRRGITISSALQKDVLTEGGVKKLQALLPTLELDAGTTFQFRGEEEDKAETSAFLQRAFLIAIFLVAIVLVTQFNSFFRAGLVLSAIVLATFGVFLGFLLRGMPFGIVMGGIGIIALAGIIVSNNIILIDTFDHLWPGQYSLREAIIRTGVQRLRPVILTKLTTILGLLPIFFGLNVDFMNFNMSVGAPATQWWTQLSTAIVFGVLFASALTLFVTPCSLWLRFRDKSVR